MYVNTLAGLGPRGLFEQVRGQWPQFHVGINTIVHYLFVYYDFGTVNVYGISPITTFVSISVENRLKYSMRL
jgi:hypothetical protein